MISTETRFWVKVNKQGPRAGRLGFCWEYMGGQNGNGYTRFWINGHMVYAHRYAYELLVGPIPEGLTIDHLCRNRVCVRPSHLEAVTEAVNIQRGEAGQHNARKTHCIHDHPLFGNNLYIRPDGRRQCRVCNREHNRRYRIERRLAA